MSDKKGKGSGTKDACYHKVKARYSVWPSAYASGALVKCRKKGAANWGNSTKKESFEVQDGVVEGAMPEPIDPKKHKEAQKKQKIRKLAIGNENPNEKKVAEKKAGGPKLMGEGKYSKSETYVKGTAPVRDPQTGESYPKETYKKKSIKKEEVELEEKKKSGDPCWVGYKQVGMKKKGGKMVPNCVPEETEVEEGYKPIDKKKENEMYRRAGNLARKSLSSTGAKKKESASKSAKIVSAISRQKENERFDKMADVKARDNYTEEIVQSILEKCWAGYEKKGMKTMFGKRYPNCVKKKATRKEEVELDERTRYAKETGKDPQTGKPSVKGGEKPSGAFAAVSKELRKSGGLMSSRKKAIQPQGKKKVPGAKVLKGTTPVDKIKAKLAQQRASKPNPYKPRVGESD